MFDAARLYRLWDARYTRLATLSVAHLYNLRHQAGYQATRAHWTKTRGYAVPIGQRRAPTPDGRPGFVRIDSVHQGDQDGAKGLYHINAVDCVTQYEIVATCERLSEAQTVCHAPWLHREMGCTRAEFLRWLPGATRYAPMQIHADKAVVHAGEARVEIAFTQALARKIALVSMPVLKVSFRFSGAGASAYREIMAYFDLYTTRDGG